MMDNLNRIHAPYNSQPQAGAITDDLPDRPKMREVATWLGFSYELVRQMALEGKIPCKRIKRKKYNVYLFDKAALLEWARPEGAA